jgi:peptidoglycan/xylan/chitin deacetylase (PgdA/CDA1 family)
VGVGLGALALALVAAPGTADVRLQAAAPPPPLPAPPLTVREARLAVREHAAISRVLGYTSSVSSGGPGVREVALTFDDGPSVYTPAVIEVLKRLHVPATFFQTGSSIASYPLIARQELEVGLGIGDHTETHPFLAALAPGAQRAEIIAGARHIHQYGAPYPRLFRPPYESYDQGTLAVARAARMLMVLWSVDTRDFSRPGAAQIVASAVSAARPGAIILMHDGGGPRDQTVAALPGVIRGLRRRHFRLVTVGRLLLDDPPPRPPPAAAPRRPGASAAHRPGPPPHRPGPAPPRG